MISGDVSCCASGLWQYENHSPQSRFSNIRGATVTEVSKAGTLAEKSKEPYPQIIRFSFRFIQILLSALPLWVCRGSLFCHVPAWLKEHVAPAVPESPAVLVVAGARIQ